MKWLKTSNIDSALDHASSLSLFFDIESELSAFKFSRRFKSLLGCRVENSAVIRRKARYV
jgi:hypothetical protein